jgi:hypothetical protein
MCEERQVRSLMAVVKGISGPLERFLPVFAGCEFAQA